MKTQLKIPDPCRDVADCNNNGTFLTNRAHTIATDIDLIIGRPHVKSHVKSLKLVERFPSYFTIVDKERRVFKGVASLVRRLTY